MLVARIGSEGWLAKGAPSRATDQDCSKAHLVSECGCAFNRAATLSDRQQHSCVLSALTVKSTCAPHAAAEFRT